MIKSVLFSSFGVNALAVMKYVFFFILFRRANEILKIETKMFESHLKRVDPKDLTGQNAGEYLYRVLSSVFPNNRRRGFLEIWLILVKTRNLLMRMF